MSFTGLVIESLGWESVFYLIGGIYYFWILFWWYFMHDTPAQHPRITYEEKEHIENSIAASVRNMVSNNYKATNKSVPSYIGVQMTKTPIC